MNVAKGAQGLRCIGVDFRKKTEKKKEEEGKRAEVELN